MPVLRSAFSPARLETTTDSRGTAPKTFYDRLGRVTKTIEGYTVVALTQPIAVNQPQAPDDRHDAGAWWEDLDTFSLRGHEARRREDCVAASGPSGHHTGVERRSGAIR